MVIIGITIAFSLNNWRDGRQARKMEQEYLQNMLADLKVDRQKLHWILADDSTRNQHLDSLIFFTRQPEQASPKAVFTYYLSNNYYLPFKAEQTTYQIMTATGGLNLIGDFALRQQVVQVYSQLYGGLASIDDALTEHCRNYTVDFFVTRMRFRQGEIADLAPLRDPMLQNILYGQRGLVARRQEVYRLTLKQVETLIAEIENTL